MQNGETRRLELRAGALEYTDDGSGPVLVFVHGVFVNGGLWRSVAPPLTNAFRCIVPTLPLGAHALPMNAGADLSPLGLAGLLAEVLDELDLQDVTLVGNDTGGALCQLVLAHHPQRVARIVLTNCDAFECFPPRLLAPIYLMARFSGFMDVLATLLRWERAQALFFATVAKSKPDAAYLSATFRTFLASRAVRRDLHKTLLAVDKRDTLAAASAFGAFRGRALIVWGTSDLFFPVALGERLAAAFPRATLELVEDCRTFVPEDASMQLSALIRTFAGAPVLR